MRYQIDSIHVSHERLNDEVIIINAVSGAYYSGTGSFADLWDMLMAGASAAEIADELAAQYAADASLILPDILAAIASAPRDAGPRTTYAAEDVVVRPYGTTAALTFRLVAHQPDGTTLRFRNSGTFLWRDGRWAVVTWQATPIAATP